jgi:hypothetical protein
MATVFYATNADNDFCGFGLDGGGLSWVRDDGLAFAHYLTQLTDAE